MCPYYLDGDRTRNGSVIPVVDCGRDECATAMATVQFSRIAGGNAYRVCGAVRGMRGVRPACAGLSKLNSMPAAGAAPQEGSAIAGVAAGQARSTC